MIARITVRLAEELKRRAKRKAVAERRSLNSLIEEGLRRVIMGKRKTRSPRRQEVR
jgi:predicted HicB family RNase H-like nuclease